MSSTDGRNPLEDREKAFRALASSSSISQLRRTADWFYTQSSRSQSGSTWRSARDSSSLGGYSEEAWSRYQKRLQEEYEEEMKRVERIRHMQRVFNREREKFKRSYDRWRDNDFGAYQNAYRHIPRDDWYYNFDWSYRQTSDYRSSFRQTGNYSMPHHYSVLGLDRY